MRKIRRSAGALLLAGALLAAVCAAPAIAAQRAHAAATHTVTLSANKSGLLKYNTSKITTTAGTVKIVFTNQSPVSHDVVLINSKNKVLGKTPIFDHGTKSFTVKLTKGKYTYYCSVPGHRQAGMHGTLTVT